MAEFGYEILRLHVHFTYINDKVYPHLPYEVQLPALGIVFT